MKVCLPDSAKFRVTQSWRLDSVVWDFGVPGIGPVVTTSDSVAFLYPGPGIYPVRGLVFRGCPTRADTILDTVQVFIAPNPQLPGDTALCQGSLLPLDVSSMDVTYLWHDGSTNPTFQAGTAGVIWAELSNACGQARDSMTLFLHQPGSISLGPDTSYLCAGDSLVIQLSLDQGTFVWENGSTSPNRSITGPGLYMVEAANACDLFRDTLTVLPLALPLADLGADTTLCQGDQLLLTATAPQGSVLWSNGSTASQIAASTAGTYFVQAQNACAVVRDTLSMVFHAPPVADLGPDQVRCQGDLVQLDLSQPFASFLWEDGSTLATRSLSQAGLYHVAVSTACGTERDSLVLSIEIPPVVDLGPDSSLCPGETITLQATGLSGVTFLWSTGAQSAAIQVNAPGLYELTVSGQACESSDAILLTALEPPQVELGPDTLLCDGNSLLLDASFPNASYLWSTGETTPEVRISAPGRYEVTLSNRCGSAIDDISISTGSTPVVDLGPDRTACTGDTIWLDATIPFGSYRWQDGDSSASYPARSTGLYQVTVSTACGTAMEEVYLDFVPLPELGLGPDTLICEGEFYVLTASEVIAPGPFLTAIEWPDGSSGAEFVFSEPGDYRVLARNDCGEVSDSLVVDFRDCECRVFIANAFSPNDDGHNDVFVPGVSCDLTSYQFSIYNRWGRQVFTTTDPGQGWDGLNAPEGVYAWMASYRWIGRGGVEVRENRGGTVVLGR